MRVERHLHIQRGPKKRNLVTRKNPVFSTVGEGHTQRISKLMALAIRFDGLLRNGTVKDQSELATLAHVSQPRMTQIMNLLLLAPDIQEELLSLPKVTGKDVITEKRDILKSCVLLKWKEVAYPAESITFQPPEVGIGVRHESEYESDSQSTSRRPCDW